MYDSVSTRCYETMDCENALRQSRRRLPNRMMHFRSHPIRVHSRTVDLSDVGSWRSQHLGSNGASPRTYCEHIMTISSFFINQVSGLGSLRGAGSRIESLEIIFLVWTAQSLSYNADQSQQCSLNGIITTLEGLPSV